jgi:cholesterol transport system auxiliary component
MKIIATYAMNTRAKCQFGVKFLKIMALAIATAALLACSTALPQAPASKTVYDFGPAFVAAANPSTSSAKPIALADVQAISALSGTAMLYRLGYANAQQLLPYTQARWSMPPAQLVQQRLVQELSQTRVVLGSAGNGAVQLHIELQEFSHYFDSASSSKALLRLRATLLDAQGKELAQRSFASEHPATSSDAAGGAAALAKAASSAVAQILAWLPP